MTSRLTRAMQRDAGADQVCSEGSRLISLSQGTFAIVDDADFDELNAVKWTLHSQGYAFRQTGGRKNRSTLLMHRVIMETPAGLDTDHINGNKLDNRRSNLRVATRGQNNVNRNVLSSNSTGLKGVHAPEQTSQGMAWPASITVGNKAIHLGRYASPEDAARAVDLAAHKHFGEFARLNFPERINEPPPTPVTRPAVGNLPARGSQARRLFDFLSVHVGHLFTAKEAGAATSVTTGNANRYLITLARRGHVLQDKSSYPTRYGVANEVNQ